MMTQLRGLLLEKCENVITLLVNESIGYELRLPQNQAANLPNPGQPVQLWIHTIHKEDEVQGYAFLDPFSKEIFRTLLKATGVGAKIALNLIGTLTLSEIHQAIVDPKSSILNSKVAGIGTRLAARMQLELSTSIQKLFREAAEQPKRFACVEIRSTRSCPEEEAFRALMTLGYKEWQAREWVEKAKQGQPTPETTETLLKAALQLIQPI